MLRRCFAIFAGLFLPLMAVGQSTYNIGYGEASLEPENSFLSVALQGYGHPSQGRFSLEWRGLESVEVNEPLSFTGNDKGLYALALNGDLYHRDMTNAKWCDVGATNPVVLLAGSSPDSYKVITAAGQNLYGISLLNELYCYDTGKSPMSWSKLAKTPDAIAMAACNGSVYVASADGVLHKGDVTREEILFEAVTKIPGNAYSMSIFRERLYVLLDNQSIWEYDLTESLPWRMVAYLNGITYREPLRYIAVSGERLYGLGFDNRLFEASSRTEGNISVRSVAVSDGKSTIIISGMDLAALDYDFVCEMKDEVAAETGINPDNMLVNLSHSHFTPVSKNWFAFGDSGIPDKRYMALVKEAYVKSVKDALVSMSKGKISIARGSAEVGYNRGLSGSEAVVDTTLDVAQFEILSDSSRLLLFENACHPVFPNAGKERFTISANWPGVSREYIEKSMPGVRSIYLQGCAGDINPLSQDYHRTGEDVAKSVVATIGEKMTPVCGRIRVKVDSVHVPVSVMSRGEVEIFRKANINRTGDIEAQKNVRWADHMLRLYAEGRVPDTMPVYFRIFDIGNWRIVGLSREPVTEYALRIRALWPKKHVTVLGYTDDVRSYLTSDVHLRAGNYESHDSFFWYAEPSYFPPKSNDMIVERIGQAAK